MLIPVRDEASAIEECLDAVLANSVAPDEVIVVDGCSTDGTTEIIGRYIERHPNVRLLSNPRRTVPVALNLGWRATDCELIVRVDGHAVIPTDYLSQVRSHLAGGSWQGVGGRKVPESSTATGRIVAAAMGSRWGVGGSRYHYASRAEPAKHVPFGAYPRAVIAALGGWDENLSVNQDFEFDHRLLASGGRILFEPAMSTRWACSPTLRDLAHQYHRYGRGKASVAAKHPRSVCPRHVLPPLLVLGLATAGCAAVAGRPRGARRVLAGYVLAMGTSVLSGSARPLPPGERLRFPVVVAVMHNAWGIGFLRGAIDLLVGRRPPDPYRRRGIRLAAPPGAGE